MSVTLKFAAASATALAAACGLPLGAESDAEGPVACALEITQGVGQVSVDAVVEARAAVTGHYDLTLRQQGAGNWVDLSQSGEISLAEGQRASLGQAQLTGRAADIEADLTLDVNGLRIRCPITF